MESTRGLTRADGWESFGYGAKQVLYHFQEGLSISASLRIKSVSDYPGRDILATFIGAAHRDTTTIWGKRRRTTDKSSKTGHVRHVEIGEEKIRHGST